MNIFLVFHAIIESPAVAENWPIADFQALIEWLVAKKVDCPTIDEWYEGLINPRHRAIPLNRQTV